MEKTCFTLAFLTSCGRIPLLALNDIITSVLRGGPSLPIGWLLLHTFYQSRLATSANTGLDQDGILSVCLDSLWGPNFLSLGTRSEKGPRSTNTAEIVTEVEKHEQTTLNSGSKPAEQKIP